MGKSKACISFRSIDCVMESSFLITAYACTDLTYLILSGSPYLINGSELTIRIYFSTRYKIVN